MRTIELNLDELTTAAQLTGRIDLLMEMREWLDEKIAAAERANEQLRQNSTPARTQGG